MSIINLPVQPGVTDFNNVEQVEKLRDTIDQIMKREISTDQYFALNEVSMLLSEIMLSLRRQPTGHLEFQVEDDDFDNGFGTRIIAPSAEEAARQFAMDFPDATTIRVNAHGRVERFRCVRSTQCTMSLICSNHREDRDGYCVECGLQ